MSPFVEQALQEIDSADPKVAAEGFFKLAEVVAVNRIQNFESEFFPEANLEILEWAPLEKIQRAVQHWIERNPDHQLASTAFWVLDKFRDDALRPFLRHWLQYYVQRIQPSLAPLGQILVDLNSIGEPAISDPYYSAAEHGKNLDDAIRYLHATSPKE